MSSKQLPQLYVEGNDDVSVISALLRRLGLDTERGNRQLTIKAVGSIEELLAAMPNAIKAATSYPIGFVVDIDIEVSHRWDGACSRLREIGLKPPAKCPEDGFIGKIPDYPHEFGVWLMPDCRTDGFKLENLIETLIPQSDPLWSHAQKSTDAAAQIIDEVNEAGTQKWKRFSEPDRIKAEVRSWLAWQVEPGVQLGAAINDRILGCDSHDAIAFLRWLKKLFGFQQLAV